MRDEHEISKVKSATRKPDVLGTRIYFRIYGPGHPSNGGNTVYTIFSR
jgi:hypothetical protein